MLGGLQIKDGEVRLWIEAVYREPRPKTGPKRGEEITSGQAMRWPSACANACRIAGSSAVTKAPSSIHCMTIAWVCANGQAAKRPGQGKPLAARWVWMRPMLSERPSSRTGNATQYGDSSCSFLENANTPPGLSGKQGGNRRAAEQRRTRPPFAGSQRSPSNRKYFSQARNHRVRQAKPSEDYPGRREWSCFIPNHMQDRPHSATQDRMSA